MTEPRARRPRRSGPAPASRGFGLLEAIVALTLLASTGVALFAWIQQNLQAAARVRTIEQEAQLQINAQSLMQGIDPMRRPSGEMQVSGLALRWQAQALEPPRPNLGFTAGAAGPWLVGLYRVDVRARDERSGVEVRFDMWQVAAERKTERPQRGSP